MSDHTNTQTPDDRTLSHYVLEGLSHQQMVERWEQESGYRATISAIRVRLLRAGHL